MIDWRRAATGGWVALLPTGERLFITPHAFGSNTFRLRGNEKVGQNLYNHQFYPTLKSAKMAAQTEFDRLSKLE